VQRVEREKDREREKKEKAEEKSRDSKRFKKRCKDMRGYMQESKKKYTVKRQDTEVRPKGLSPINIPSL